MAELVLGRAGAAVGAALLPKELAFIGGALGTIAGATVNARFLSPPAEGARIAAYHLTEGREGAAIPIIYGRCRVGSQLIWAANFKERREVEGGKGGPRVAEYSYSLSFAVALCEGEVARISRCWANGAPFDLSQVTWRLYQGTEDQTPDPLIEAIEGEAPAYRGTAYIVFEDMPVDQFGARMPQLSFEVIRPAGNGAGRLETVVRAVNMIPGSGEFALSTEIVRRRLRPGQESAENLHGAEAVSDFEASIDQLEAELPNVTRVNLVVAWFGSDLRCGECLVRPGVELVDKTTVPATWNVAGVGRGDAYVVSATDGRPNYGGTPSDISVKQAIALLKARGYHVTLYPFLLMDIPRGNGLPDPYGGEEQAAFPWRGRITAIGDDTEAQVAAFFERYRAFVLHYAAIADDAGADGLLIGSELVGLTRIQSSGVYPAVQALSALAGDVREVVGEAVDVSYAADWTEYGAHNVGDDVAFPLDALWADEAISYVGIDWYPPMADWRDSDDHADAAFGDSRSQEYLLANIAGGEAFDWYYADGAGRLTQERLAITDGAYGEAWVFRQKDVRSWWSNLHFSRADGVRAGAPTGWTPGMKPVRFVEFGVPAVDKGANQPNVFYDPKSSESALPHFSDGSRDDLIQRSVIEAFHAFWLDDANNPFSSIYAGRMIPTDGVGVWAWDARPYPAFPARSDVWGDADNWRLAHWLNGRVGLALLPDVVADICQRVDVVCDTTDLAGVVTGYEIAGPLSARAALEPVAAVHGFDATERDDEIVFRMRGGNSVELDIGRLVATEGPALTFSRTGMETSGIAVRLRYVDADTGHEPGIVMSLVDDLADVVDVEAALVMDKAQARRVAGELAVQLTLQRERARFAMSADGLALEAGDIVSLGDAEWRVLEVSDGKTITFDVVRAGSSRAVTLTPSTPVASPSLPGPVEPDVLIVDGPPLPGHEDDLRPIGFASASPWVGRVAFSAGADATIFTGRGAVERPCLLGQLESDLYPHVSGRWQETSVFVRVWGGALSSKSDVAILNGANSAFVETANGWELIQYREAELIDVDTYKLMGLLRGQQGSDPAMDAGAVLGARVAFLTGAESRMNVADWERGLNLLWRAAVESPSAAVWTGEAVQRGGAGRMWSPAHLRASKTGEDISLAWIRRARKGGDAWLPGEPAVEGVEAYRVRVSEGIAVREWDVDSPAALYTAAEVATDFPSGGAAILEVAQLGPDGEPGGWSKVELTIPAP